MPRLDMISQQIQEPFKMHNSIVRAAPQRRFYKEREGLPFYNDQDVEGVAANYIDLRHQTMPPPFVLPTKAHSVQSQVSRRTTERAKSVANPPFVPPPSQIEKLKTKVKHLERDKANLQIQMRLLREDYEEKMWQLQQELEASRAENKRLRMQSTGWERQVAGESKTKSPEHVQDRWYNTNPLFMTPGRITYQHDPIVETSNRQTPSRSHRRLRQFALEDPHHSTRTKIPNV